MDNTPTIVVGGSKMQMRKFGDCMTEDIVERTDSNLPSGNMYNRNMHGSCSRGRGKHLVTIAEDDDGVGRKACECLCHPPEAQRHCKGAGSVVVAFGIDRHTPCHVEPVGGNFVDGMAIAGHKVHICSYNIDLNAPSDKLATYRPEQSPVGTRTCGNRYSSHILFESDYKVTKYAPPRKIPTQSKQQHS